MVYFIDVPSSYRAAAQRAAPARPNRAAHDRGNVLTINTRNGANSNAMTPDNREATSKPPTRSVSSTASSTTRSRQKTARSRALLQPTPRATGNWTAGVLQGAQLLASIPREAAGRWSSAAAQAGHATGAARVARNATGQSCRVDCAGLELIPAPAATRASTGPGQHDFGGNGSGNNASADCSLAAPQSRELVRFDCWVSNRLRF